MLDFNDDSKISKEDVRILMSCIPFKNSSARDLFSPRSKVKDVGCYKENLGKNQNAYNELREFLENTWPDSSLISFNEFTQINQNVSTALF